MLGRVSETDSEQFEDDRDLYRAVSGEPSACAEV